MALEGTDAGADAEVAPLPPLLPVELPLEDPLPLVGDPPLLLPLELPLLEVEPLVARAAPAEMLRTPPQPLDMVSPTAAAKNRGVLCRNVFIESP
jgi:hypothetical protein